jgi:diadenylate cyclase
MRLDQFLNQSRVIDLKSRDFRAALLELLDACPESALDGLDRTQLVETILKREGTLPTHLDNSVALPHLRLPLGRRYLFAVGRCPNGLTESPDAEDREVRVVFLVLASDKEKSYLAVLSTLAGALEDKAVVERLEAAPDLKGFRAEIAALFKGVSGKTSSADTRFNRLFVNHAEKIAVGADCSSIMVFMDAFNSPVKVGKFATKSLNTIVVTRREYEIPADAGDEPDMLVVRSFSNHRMSQLRSALLIGLMRGVIKADERICCLGGLPGSDKLDSILVVDVAKEFPAVLAQQRDKLLPAKVNPEVLERALGIATELAVEGREGKPIGCILVIGDRDKLKPHTKPLILNPFYGYPEEDRNILSPFMDETVKELSGIDGACVIESAGTLLTAPNPQKSLAGGLGTRHAAACAISVAADCVALVVSTSTGQVTLFRRGEPIVLLDRSANRML